MTTEAFRKVWVVPAALAAAALLHTTAPVSAQTTQPSTLRYGSGLIDVPVGSVLPHLTVTGMWSGFFADPARKAEINPFAQISGYTNAESRYYSDGSIALGLFDRAEVGATIQSLGEVDAGGNVWGLFGRLNLIKPDAQGMSLAVGGRFVRAPDFGNGESHQPTRLGITDDRFMDSYLGHSDEVANEASLYVVSSLHFRGPAIPKLPQHDFTITGGYGTGMFQGGDFIDFYRFADSEGWFLGSAMHFELGHQNLLAIMGEYNGFDVNFGAQMDVKGVRFGAHVLGANYTERPAGGYYSVYRMPKYGFTASLALAPGGDEGLTHKPRIMVRPAPDTFMLPAPPPDTVTVTREVAPPMPDGTPATVCLATGTVVTIHVSPQGDTLVGPTRVPMSELGPGIVFDGDYAAGAQWYLADEAITFEEREYQRSGTEVSLDCTDVMRVGEHMGVALFAMREEDRPFGTLYVPVRPGAWQGYETNLQATRGK